MSDKDRDPSSIPCGPAKKRRIPGACDECKRKKGDSAKMPDNRCTSCIQQSLECTHKEVGKTLGSAKRYVDSLEGRLEKLDKLFSKLLPGLDINEELAKVDRGEDEPEKLLRNDDETSALAQQMGSLTMLNPLRARFFGKSSNVQLFKTCLDMKWHHQGLAHADDTWIQHRRAEFWEVPEWAEQDHLSDVTHPLQYDYPPEDLTVTLIDLYFTHLNPLIPLLHRPTFEQAMKQGLHFRNLQFGATVLLVCAHGSKYSNDPRVLVDGVGSWLSAGWKWYKQTRHLGQQIPYKCTLYDLQMLCLLTFYAIASPVQDNFWVQIGVAMKLAIDVGAHIKKGKDSTPTDESELWKRAFWCCWALDHRYSVTLGRAPSLKEEDLDIDFPVECDDEYWENGFKQPTSRPSRIVYFNQLLRLSAILGRAMRLIYSIKRPHNPFLKAPIRSEADCISELDSMLNDWLASLPPHLQWESEHYNNNLFKIQSAYLHASFYHHQIFIHRPYIPTPKNPVPGPFPALTICTNAARSCIRVLEEMWRLDGKPSPTPLEFMFISGMILLANVWSPSPSSDAQLQVQIKQDIERCLQVTRQAEDRWALGGRFTDILGALSGECLLVDSQMTLSRPQNKRNRDDDEGTHESTEPLYTSSSISFDDRPRGIAGPKRVSSFSPSMEGSVSNMSTLSTPSQAIQVGDSFQSGIDVAFPEFSMTQAQLSHNNPANSTALVSSVNPFHDPSFMQTPIPVPFGDSNLGSQNNLTDHHVVSTALQGDIASLWAQEPNNYSQLDPWSDFWSWQIDHSMTPFPSGQGIGQMQTQIDTFF